MTSRQDTILAAQGCRGQIWEQTQIKGTVHLTTGSLYIVIFIVYRRQNYFLTDFIDYKFISGKGEVAGDETKLEVSQR